MRSLGLVTLVVAVIFAAAFGVYYWLGGSQEPEMQVVDTATPPTREASKETPAAPVQTNPGQPTAESLQVSPDTGDSASGQPESSGEDTLAAVSTAGTSGQSSGAEVQSSQSAPTQTGDAVSSTVQNAPAESGTNSASEQISQKPKRPHVPQVVARAEPNTQVKATDKPAAKSAGPVPSFDVVRVEKNGEAVLAGRAPAGSEVTIYDGDTPLGIVLADARGQWVLILDVPLLPGSHSLGITARQTDETVVESANLVIVAVPEPQLPSQPTPTTQDVASLSSDQESGVPSNDETAGSSGAAIADNATASSGESMILAEGAIAQDADPAMTKSAGESVTGAAAAASGAGVNTTSEGDDVAESPVAPTQVDVASVGIEEPIAVIVPRHGTGPTRILQQPELTETGIGNGSLFLDSVDYNDEGRAVIGGRAAPGASLIIYLDNLPVGEALTDDGGRWAMTPEDLVPVGLHRLRVDQIETGGKVLARVETPFSRADTVASHPDENFVTVQPGNSLWRIARATYGEGTRYTVIYESNKLQIRDPDLIYPGQIFRLPSGG